MNKNIFLLLPLVLAAVISMLAVFGELYNKSDKNPIKPDVETIGVTDNEIVIGSSAALSGHAEFLGQNYARGAQAYFNEINREGGLFGRTIKLVSYDDSYDPPLTVANTQKLINDDEAFMLCNFVGTPTISKAIPLINEARIPLVGVLSGAQILRDPVNPYIFNIRGSYYRETGRAIAYFIEDMGIKKIAVFFQKDAYGLDGLSGAQLGLKNYSLEPVAEAGYARGSMEVEGAVEKILAASPEAVIMAGTYSPSAKFVKLMKEAGSRAYFYSVSFVGPDEFLKELGADGEGVIISQVVPPHEETEAGIAGGEDAHREFHALWEKEFPGEEPSTIGFEGFVNAKVVIEGLKRAGRDLTRTKFIKALESLDQFDPGIGSGITYSATDHQGADNIYFSVIKNEKIDFFSDWNELKIEKAN